MILLKHEQITRNDNQPHLWRFVVIKCNWFSIMVHRFLAPDDVCEHDHPWPFISVILRRGYWEHSEGRKRWYGVGSVLCRPALWRHRIEINGRILPCGCGERIETGLIMKTTCNTTRTGRIL